MSENTRVSVGKRMSFEIHDLGDGKQLHVSRKIYTDGRRLCRVHIDYDSMEWRIVDAVTGAAYLEGGQGISNHEVLVRSAKRNLKKFLDVYFEKEERKVKNESK